jgi:hypothetical protein
MRLRELDVGFTFVTKLTGRKGVVVGFNREKGTLVKWLEENGRETWVHPNVIVDQTPGVLVRQ